MKLRVRSIVFIMTTAVLLLSGCASIGPGTIKQDRFQYMKVISETWKSQLLFNMVKLRYGDTPGFLEVASVINSYSVEGSINMNVSWYENPYSNPTLLGGFARFSDRPTITYTPLTGVKFTTMLMSPIEPTNLFSFIQAGYRADLLLRLCVQSINGINNQYGGGSRFKNADPEFYELIEKIQAIQDSGAMGMRVEKRKNKEVIMLIFRDPRKLDEQIKADMAAAKKLLGLDPKAREFRVVYDAVAANNKEIAILSRSMLQILIDLSSYIDVPEKHIAEKRVGPTRKSETVEGSIRPLIQINSQASISMTSKPSDAFSAVKYKNYWFWVDDKDLLSKQIISFLLVIFSLGESGGGEGAPIVTVPAG